MVVEASGISLFLTALSPAQDSHQTDVETLARGKAGVREAGQA